MFCKVFFSLHVEKTRILLPKRSRVFWVSFRLPPLRLSRSPLLPGTLSSPNSSRTTERRILVSSSLLWSVHPSVPHLLFRGRDARLPESPWGYISNPPTLWSSWMSCRYNPRCGIRHRMKVSVYSRTTPEPIRPRERMINVRPAAAFIPREPIGRFPGGVERSVLVCEEEIWLSLWSDWNDSPSDCDGCCLCNATLSLGLVVEVLGETSFFAGPSIWHESFCRVIVNVGKFRLNTSEGRHVRTYRKENDSYLSLKHKPKPDMYVFLNVSNKCI